MKCFLHIGTEKTGSSYLQCKLALSRQALLDQGFWFAYGAAFDERCMKQGRISGGNALKLAGAIGADEWNKADRFLFQARTEAERRKVDRVILSSELLLSPLSRSNRLAEFREHLHRSGFEMTGLFLVVRDPQDQFVSLYKHRAKSGTVGAISAWAATGYRLPEELKSLRDQCVRYGIRLSVRKYDRRAGALDRMFFDDWLGISTPKVDLPPSVNPSLTLSELAMIRTMTESRAELVKPLYEALRRIPSGEKVKGRKLEAYARGIAARAVAAHSEEWAAWNELLPNGEKLNIPESPDPVPGQPTELVFSKRQVEAITELLAKAATPTFLARTFWRSRLRPSLGRVARAMGLRR